MGDTIHTLRRVLRLSLLSSYLCAVAYIAVLYYSLPPTNLAYGEGLPLFLLDPFVLTAAIPVATVAGLVMAPVALVCLRRRHLERCGCLVLCATILGMAVVEMISLRYALLAAPIITVAGLALCAVLPIKWLDVQDSKPRVQ